MPRTPIPFGGSGLIQGTGTMATQPAALEDIRNVSLRPGRTARRPGLFAVASIPFGTDVIGIHPMRATGVTAVVGYQSTTRVVTLFMVAPDYTVRTVGTIWTLDPGTAFPKVSMTDVWNRLAIAHDEANYGKRKETMLYRAVPTEGFDLLSVQLNAGSNGPQPIKFRGVSRYLTYLAGWGYGMEPSTNPPTLTLPTDTENSRPELVRLSLPDDPTKFVPEHYFICGQRDDPVLGCWIAGERLLARKSTETYAIYGSDRPSFGIVQVDSLFGVASSRLAVTVGNVNYCWSHDGPRRSTGGASEDQALPLDLANFGLTTPADLDTDTAFAAYDPVERVVLFVFGTLTFCWHMEVEQWSLRDYAPGMYTGGIFVRDGASSGAGPVADTTLTASRVTAPTSAATTPGEVDVTVAGVVLGGEVLQVWGRARNVAGAVWAVLGTKTPTIVGLNTVTVSWPKLGVTFDLATRLAISGVAGASYRSSDPTAWPAPSQGTRQVPLPVIASRLSSGTSAVFDTQALGAPDLGVMRFLVTAPAAGEAHLLYDIRHKLAGGGDGAAIPVSLVTVLGGGALSLGIDAIRGTVRVIEVRVKTAELTGAWIEIEAARWMGPLGFFQAEVSRLVTGSYRWSLTAPPEPVYAFMTSGVARLQFQIGAGAMADETNLFFWTPAEPTPGFNSVVATTDYWPGRSNTETAFQARREVSWQGQLYVSPYFLDNGPF